MNKKILMGFLLLLSIIMLTGCKKDQMMKDYPGLDDKDHVFVSINVDDVISMLENKETFYLVMGFPTCPWCQALMPVLNEVAKDKKVNKIYYLYLKEIRDDTSNVGHASYLVLKNTYFSKAVLTNDRLNAPTLVKVVKGVLEDYHLNTVDSHIKNENGVLPPLNDSQLEELKTILNTFLS